MSLISIRVTFTPHGLVASSTMCKRRALISSRFESNWSRSIDPITVLMLVIVRFKIAFSR